MKMQKLFITKDNLRLLTEILKRSCGEFIAPKKEHLDDIIFGDVKNSDAGLLDYDGNSVISPRAFLLPQTEPLFEIKSAKNCNFVAMKDKKKRIFYGVRPCDIKAIALMRKFFLDDPADNFYREKIKNSIFIALACGRRCSEKSFCREIDAGPIAKDGFDLQLIPLSKGYLVEAGSKTGNSIIKKNRKLFIKASPLDEKESKEILREFTKKAGKKINYNKIARIMKENKVGESIWDDIGRRCVICSGCITLCPTCSCFSIMDRMDGQSGVRMRYCDGCPYAGFTKMAGGSSPEPLHKDHIRRFFEHKLNVDVERYGRPSCVGCARCIQTCPGNISIKKFIDEVA